MARRLKTQNLNPVFHRRTETEDKNELSATLINNSRKTGMLNLSSKGLSSGEILITVCFFFL